MAQLTDNEVGDRHDGAKGFIERHDGVMFVGQPPKRRRHGTYDPAGAATPTLAKA